jgi:hypothetical protein
MDMKTRYVVLGAALLAMAAAQPLGAASTTSSLTVNATVAATAQLTIGGSAINFKDANPDSTPSITATENPVAVTAKGKTSTSGAITLTLLAGNDLTSGSDSIGISNVTWTATGSGYTPGTMNKTTAQSVASWTGSGARVGALSFALANSWSYPTGSYTTTATFTLTAP